MPDMTNVRREENLRDFKNDLTHVINSLQRLSSPGVVTVDTPELESLVARMRDLRAEFS